MLSLSGLISRIGTHHRNYYEHMNTKKEESILKKELLLPPNYDLLRHNIERQKSSPALSLPTGAHTHIYPTIFDGERTDFLCSSQFHWNKRVFTLRVNVRVCLCRTRCSQKAFATVWLMKKNFCFHWD